MSPQRVFKGIQGLLIMALPGLWGRGGPPHANSRRMDTGPTEICAQEAADRVSEDRGLVPEGWWKCGGTLRSRGAVIAGSCRRWMETVHESAHEHGQVRMHIYSKYIIPMTMIKVVDTSVSVEVRRGEFVS